MNGSKPIEVFLIDDKPGDVSLVQLALAAHENLTQLLSTNMISWGIFSSPDNPRDKGRLLALGASDCVRKPSDLNSFTMALWDVVDGRVPVVPDS